MHETAQDLAQLQRLLDESYARAGSHLRSIFTEDRRLSAAALADVLQGVRVLNLATVTAAGEPRVAPVDGLFYRGHFWFGSSPESARFRHITRRPQVSAAHTVGEELAVIVHGIANRIDPSADAGFRACCLEVYGPSWEEWGAGAAYARIDAARMYTFSNPPR